VNSHGAFAVAAALRAARHAVCSAIWQSPTLGPAQPGKGSGLTMARRAR
jgi:hypothetical protein